ncbi:MAG: cell wall-binding repeat-containing protein [Microcella sp.]|uniref:cell wall-binding repeat-containing protein n=1 Tax=Microcella sp. TaxID=1913979 RepID=UPI0027235ED4|nr:cell wall-binding repeat-containing protein [Microcella sp.]MDO8338004.1 cell wall-binding repeat-containing protein [Microcella sp.]
MRALIPGVVVAAVALLAPLGASPALARPQPPVSGVGLPSTARPPVITPPFADPAAFREEARALPAALTQALSRDVGLTGAEYLAHADLAVRGLDIVSALEAADVDVTGSQIDDGALVVTVATAADVARADELGVEATTEPVPELDLSGIVFDPTVDLHAGAPYYYDSGTTGARCSVGFAGIEPVSGARQVITAGHCLGQSTVARRMMTMSAPNQVGILGESIGLPVANSYRAGGGFDTGLIAVSNANVVPRPSVLTWGGGTGAPLASAPLAVRDAAAVSTPGVTLCKSGSTTGWTCGVVQGIIEDQIVGDPASPSAYTIDGIAVCIRVGSGDSGGAAVVGATAVGVTSAVGSAPSMCPNSPQLLGLFTPLYSPSSTVASANSLYGAAWEPLIAVNRPTVSSFAGNDTVFSGDVLRGTLPAGRSRHRVEVVIDGGAKRTAAVANDGSWSVDIRDLGPGRHTYSLVGRWGQRSASSAATGSWIELSASRIAGSDRYDTAARISKDAFPSGSSTVLIANGLSFPDALSAGPAAGLLDAPLLLTDAKALPAATKTELARLAPTRIIVVGGASMVSSAVVTELAKTARVERWAGKDRYETSRVIAQKAFRTGAEIAYIATGSSFPDALSAGAAGVGVGAPVILVKGTDAAVDAATATALTGLGVSEARIAGGPSVVSSGIENSLKTVADTVRRLAGKDRYGTSLAINADAVGTAPTVYLASGTNFPDALAGSVLAGLRGAPMYIAPVGCVAPGVNDDIVRVQAERLVLFGGTSVLNANAARLVTC